MNSFLSVKKACATLMMLLLIMSPLSSLGPKQAMAANVPAIHISDGRYIYHFNLTVYDLDGSGPFEAQTIIERFQGGESRGDAIYVRTDGTTGQWQAGDRITSIDVYDRVSGKLITTVYPDAMAHMSDNATIIADGSINADGTMTSAITQPSTKNFKYQGPGTSGNTDAILKVEKVWKYGDTDVKNKYVEITAKRLLNGDENSQPLDGDPWTIVAPTGSYQNANTTKFMFSESIRPSTDKRFREFIKVELKQGDTLIDSRSCPNGAASCIDNGEFVVDTKGFLPNTTYTLTYYNLYRTPEPFEIVKQVEGEDIMDWCNDRILCDVDTLLTDGMLTFDLYSLADGWEPECMGGICFGTGDVNEAKVGNPILTGKLDGDGIITFEPRVFIAGGWYGVVETINPAIENYFDNKANAYFVYIKDSIAYESITEGVNPVGVDAFIFQNDGNLYNTTSLDIEVDVFDRTMQQTIEEFYVQDWREIYEQDWREIYEQDWREIYEQDWREVYVQDWREIYEQDWRKIYEQDWREVYKQDWREVYVQDWRKIYEQDWREIYEQDWREIQLQDWREIYEQDWRKIHTQDWREIQLQDWREIHTQEWRDIYAQDWRKILAQG